MAGDEWWTQAVDQFGLDTLLEPTSPTTVSIIDPVAGADDPTEPIRHRRRRIVVDWLVIAIVALAAAFLLRMFVVQQFAVDGKSMLGTLHSGDRVLVNKLSYDLHDPRHGDIVVLKDTEESLEERDLIKRVIALPGRPSNTSTASCSSTATPSPSRISIRSSLRKIIVAIRNCRCRSRQGMSL